MTHDIKPARQHGGMLLEALIGILLFSIGILAVVALQGSATKAVTQAKFRSDASFLADQLVGQIWGNRANAAAYTYAGGTPPNVMVAWIGQENGRLPNAVNYPPAVKVTPTVYAGPPAYTANQITISLFWQLPDEFNAVPRPPAHSLTFTTLIPCC